MRPLTLILTILTMLIGLGVLSGCSDRTSDSKDDGTNKSAAGGTGNGGQDVDELPTGPTLKLYPDEGPLAFKVDGVPIPKATVDRYLEIFKVRHPGTSEKTLLRDVIETGIVPTAAMYAAYAEADIEELSRRAWRAHARLERGEQWDVIAAEVSDDPNSALTRGSIGMRRRLSVPGMPNPHPEVEQAAFATKLDTWSKPFCTEKGVEIVFPTKEVRLPTYSEGEVQREILHLLFAWDAEYRAHLGAWDPDKGEEEAEAFKAKLKRLQEKMKRRMRGARIEVIDETYKPFVYPFRLKKKS